MPTLAAAPDTLTEAAVLQKVLPDLVAIPGNALQAHSPRGLDHLVDDAGRDSFPASDPPTWWAGVDGDP